MCEKIPTERVLRWRLKEKKKIFPFPKQSILRTSSLWPRLLLYDEDEAFMERGNLTTKGASKRHTGRSVEAPMSGNFTRTLSFDFTVLHKRWRNDQGEW